MNPPPNINITVGFSIPYASLTLPSAGSYTSIKRSQVSLFAYINVPSGVMLCSWARIASVPIPAIAISVMINNFFIIFLIFSLGLLL